MSAALDLAALPPSMLDWDVYLLVRGTWRRFTVRSRYPDGARWRAMDAADAPCLADVAGYVVVGVTERGQFRLLMPDVAVCPVPDSGLTEREHEALAFVIGHIEREGRPPLHEEIAVGLGLTRPRVTQLVKSLRRKHRLDAEPGKARTMTVVPEPRR